MRRDERENERDREPPVAARLPRPTGRALRRPYASRSAARLKSWRRPCKAVNSGSVRAACDDVDPSEIPPTVNAEGNALWNLFCEAQDHQRTVGSKPWSGLDRGIVEIGCEQMIAVMARRRRDSGSRNIDKSNGFEADKWMPWVITEPYIRIRFTFAKSRMEH